MQRGDVAPRASCVLPLPQLIARRSPSAGPFVRGRAPCIRASPPVAAAASMNRAFFRQRRRGRKAREFPPLLRLDRAPGNLPSRKRSAEPDTRGSRDRHGWPGMSVPWLRWRPPTQSAQPPTFNPAGQPTPGGVFIAKRETAARPVAGGAGIWTDRRRDLSGGKRTGVASHRAVARIIAIALRWRYDSYTLNKSERPFLALARNKSSPSGLIRQHLGWHIAKLRCERPGRLSLRSGLFYARRPLRHRFSPCAALAPCSPPAALFGFQRLDAP